MLTFEYVSMHILPGAIGKDFREIPKSRNSWRTKAERCTVTMSAAQRRCNIAYNCNMVALTTAI